jgi:TonB family protein
MRSTLAALCAVLSLAGSVHAQSLGAVAAEEAARRKAIQKPARVITGDDIKPADRVSTPTEVPPFPSDVAAADDPAARRVQVAPAALQSGNVPAIPVMAVAGGEVALEVDVTREGHVSAVKALRSTPPFTDAVAAAVRYWQFAPAEDALLPADGQPIDLKTRRPMASKVLVLALYRPPAIFDGATLGEPPKTVGTPSEDVAVPTSPATMPGYPANALFNGMVLIELGVTAEGSVKGAKILRSAPPFDDLALQATTTLGFRPPRVHGRSAAANVYVAVAFRQPITP